VFGVFAGWHYVFPRIAGYAYSDFLGKVHFWLCFIGANANVIVPTVFTRWIADDSDVFHIWNLISSIGTYVLLTGILVFLANLVSSLLGRGHRDAGQRGSTMENPVPRDCS